MTVSASFSGIHLGRDGLRGEKCCGSRLYNSEGFTDDGNHNRLTQTLNGVVNTYHYGAADVLNSISVNGNTVKSFGYDGAGRTTSITTNSGTTTLGYDYENRVTSLSTTGGVNDTFSYNGLDTRVGKVDVNGSHSFRRDGASVTDPVLNDGTSEYTPGISQTSGAGTTFNASDRMGSNVLQTNSSQSQTASSQYDAFGNLVSNSGTQAGPFGFNGQYGYQTDSDTKLQLLGHRYYDPTTGRFLGRDPIYSGENWYVSCANNPLNWIDPYGLWSLYRWLYTGDGNATNDVYQAALDQARRTLYCWGKHFAEDNGVAAPIGAASLGPFPKPVAKVLGFRSPTKGWTSGVRLASQPFRFLVKSANFVKDHQPELWIIYESFIAWDATIQTLRDPDSE